MPTRSKRIVLHDNSKLEQVNPENLRLLEKYKIDMTVRDLSEGTKVQYISNIHQWFIYILDKQQNRSVLELEDDDLTEFLFFCKSEGNNAARMKMRTSVLTKEKVSLYKSGRIHRITKKGYSGDGADLLDTGTGCLDA